MSNIFFPENLSPQGFITDFLTAQMHSPDFKKIREFLENGDDLSKQTEGRLIFMSPHSKNEFEKKILQTTPKVSTGNPRYDALKMRKYVDFLTRMKPAQIAALVPYIRLYVTYTASSKASSVSVEKTIGKRQIKFSQPHRLKDQNPVLLGVANKGGSNAGIANLNVSRDFQYYGTTNRYSVDMSFFFDSFATFANGSEHAGVPSLSFILSQFGIPQGSDYISLIKKGSYKSGKFIIREYLTLEYGYKFPDDISGELVDPLMKKWFEEEEKKELRLTCHKHDFRFSEKGEVVLNVSYTAAPEAAMASRSEEKRNDPFSISKASVLEEIFDEKSEGKVARLEIAQKIKNQMLDLKELNKFREKLISDYCPQEKSVAKSIKTIDEMIEEVNKKISSVKRAMSSYVDYFFMRYFMTKGHLYHIKFRPTPYEVESQVLKSASDLVIGGKAATRLSTDIYRVQPPIDSADKKLNFTTSFDYQKIIDELSKDEVKLATSIKSIRQKAPDQSSDIQNRFQDRLNMGTSSEEIYKKYSFYELLQAFTLSRLSAQHFVAHSGRLDAEVEEGAPSVVTTQDASQFNYTFGNFNFFPLKALIAAILDFAFDDDQDAKNFPMICLGNAVADSMGKKYFVNLGDLLIETNFFKEWLYKNFIDPEKFSPTMEQLISSIFDSLVPSVMSAGTGHFSKGGYGQICRQIFDISGDFFENEKNIKDLSGNNSSKRKAAIQAMAKSIKRPSRKSEIKLPFVYFYQEVHADPSNPKQAKSAFLKKFGKRNFNKAADFVDGIYHVYAGQIDGIVKELNFDYVSDPYLNSLLAKRNPNQLAAYLKYSYGASIRFVGNNLYFGRTAYFAIPVNQFNIGVRTQTPNKDVFGLSGYYQINKTVDNISMGDYTTTVTAKNMYSPIEEEAKKNKCPTNPSIAAPKKASSSEEEDEIKTYVEHNVQEYIEKALKEVPTLRERYDIKLGETKK